MTRNGSTLSANVTGPAAQRSKQTNANATAQAKANAKVVAKSLADDPTAVTVGKGFFLPDTSAPESKYTTIESANPKPTTDKSNHIKYKLAQSFLERQKALKGEDAEFIVWQTIEGEGVHTRKELEMQEKTKKYGVQLQPDLVEGLSGADILIMIKRLETQQAQFRELEKRDRKPKLVRIRSVHTYITNEEAVYALQQANNDVEEAIMRLTQFSYVQEMRKKIALTHNPIFSISEREKLENKSDSDDSDDDEDDDDDYEQVYAVRTTRSQPRRRQPSKPASSDGTSPKKSSGKKGERLRLDDALKDSENMEGWSDARVKAWKNIDTNPNSYYYRFNAPGEKQKNGSWSTEEKKLFLRRIKECDIIGSAHPAWGIFSIPIEGRVGYQCSNFYRTMLKNGELKDPNYWLEGSELRCVNGRGWRQRAEEGNEMAKKKLEEMRSGTKKTTPTKKKAAAKKVTPKEESETTEESEDDAPKKKVTPKSKKTRKASAKDDDSEEEAQPPKKRARKSIKATLEDDETEDDTEDDEEQLPDAKDEKKTPKKTTTTTTTTTTTNSKPKPSKKPSPPSSPISPLPQVHARNQNPLPGFFDPITQVEIEQPAISPHGYVAGYRTWLRILQQEPKNTCPFTKQHVAKRDLIRLNFDNIDDYRDKIKNMP